MKTALAFPPDDASQNPRLDHTPLDIRSRSVESGQTAPQAVAPTTPSEVPPAGSQTAPSTRSVSATKDEMLAEPHTSTPAKRVLTPMPGMPVVDPLLFIHVTTLTDLEQTRIATENRLRALTTSEPDDDGTMRGFGLSGDHPDVARTQGILDALVALEHGATLNLKRALRSCGLHLWIKAQRGLGDKQVARLLGAIGDPYWHLAEDRPRTVSELWAYCGLHVLPASHGHVADTHDHFAGGAQPPASRSVLDAQTVFAGGTKTSDPGHIALDTQRSCAGVAARRRKGQKANWSTEAKTRAWVIVESCMKQLDPRCKTDTGIANHQPDCGCSPYRIVVDQRRLHTAVTHPDWTPKHSQMDGMRVASKALLRDLWREAKRLHETDAP